MEYSHMTRNPWPLAISNN